MKKILKKEKGITLITLIVAVSIMIIISGLLVYNARTGIKVRNFNMMKNDIDLLNDKVNAYYVQYGALPVEIKYNVNPLPFADAINPNDSEDGYYVLDLKAFEGLTLNYGADYDRVTEDTVADYSDLYVINEQSQQIYYVKGIEMDGVMYYTNDTSEEVSLIEQKWKKVIEYYNDTMLGIDNRGNLYQISSDYNGTIKENTDYITSDKLFTELKDVEDIKIVAVSASNQHSVAIDNQGKVYTWGSNYNQQLGTGDHTWSSVPRCISDIEGNVLNGKYIIKISTNGFSTIALDNQGKVYTWGSNDDGQLGNGSNEMYSLEPICISDIEGNVLNEKNIVDISAGYSHMVALDNQGKVYTWGSNGFSQLGNGSVGSNNDKNIPICISDLSGNILNNKNIIKISAGSFHTVALDNEGIVYSWGWNEDGQLGNGTDGYQVYSKSPVCISNITNNILNGKNIVEISAGSYCTIVLDNEGKVYCWGDNSNGQLGNNSTTSSNLPICISNISNNILNEKKIVKTSIGGEHVIALDDQGKIYSWGNNDDGQLGNGTNNNSIIPICISDIEDSILNGKNIADIATGYYHSFAIDSQGNVYTWGANGTEQLGNGDSYNYNFPIQIFKDIINIIKDKYIIDIAGGYGTTIALDLQGKVYTWGSNHYGQLGYETYSNGSGSPICISDIEGNTLNEKNVIEISAGYGYIVALDDQGKVYIWGNNYSGQLGNGTNTEFSNEPICISDISSNLLNGKNIVEISAGYSYIAAIDDQGKVYTWGNNYFGQLGDGTSLEYSNQPICISDITGNILNGKNVIEIATRGDYTIALDDQGKVYAWGYNSYGQLGTGSTENINLPICISDISGNILNGQNIIKISAGKTHTLAINEQGKLYVWGNNVNGQFGDETFISSTIPVCISDLSDHILYNQNIEEIFAEGIYTIVIDDRSSLTILGGYSLD